MMIEWTKDRASDHIDTYIDEGRDAMKIQILGPGCPNCRALEVSVIAAIWKAGLDAQIEKITDCDRIAEMGVALTPALAVDGIVKQSGRILPPIEIIRLVQK